MPSNGCVHEPPPTKGAFYKVSKSRFIISVRSQSVEERKQLLGELLSEAVKYEIDILSDRDTVQSSGWLVAQMEEEIKEKMEIKFAGKLAIEPDSDLQY